jgi:peptide/nickel transport system substrate-binding protein
VKKLFLILIILVISATILIGCSKSTSTATVTSTATITQTATSTQATTSTTSATSTTTSASQPQSGGTLTFIYLFSPAKGIGWPQDTGAGNAPGYVTNFVWAEPLVLYKSDATVDPWLATHWTIADKSITFTLRKGVKFHDGTDFNADAVKFNFDEAIKAGLSTTTSWDSIEVLDAYTVRLNLKIFENSIWASLADTSSMIVSPTPAKEKGIDYARENPCGTGPFKFVSYARDQNVKFERNPNYWQSGKPYLDKIEFLTVTDLMMQESVLKSGQGDILGLVDGKTMSDLKPAGFSTQPDPGGTFFMAFDSANPDSIFTDVRMRQGMEYATNKQAIVDTLGFGYALVNNQYPSPLLGVHDSSLPDRAYDLNKAKALFAAAGHPDGFSTTWTVPPWYGDAPLIIQESLKSIGVDLTLNNIDDASFWQTSGTGWKDVLGGAVAPDPNFAHAARGSFPPSGKLYVSTKYPDGMKDLVDKALAATDPATQQQLNRQLIKLLYDDSTFVFYETQCRGYAIASYLHDGHFFEGAQYNYWSPSDIWTSKK